MNSIFVECFWQQSFSLSTSVIKQFMVEKIVENFVSILEAYHVTWKKVLHIPASQPIQTPVLLSQGSEHNAQDFAPQRLYGISNKVTFKMDRLTFELWYHRVHAEPINRLNIFNNTINNQVFFFYSYRIKSHQDKFE